MPSLTPIESTAGLLELVMAKLKEDPAFSSAYLPNLEVRCEVSGCKVNIRFVNKNTGQSVDTAHILGVLGRFCRIGSLGNLDRELVGEPSDGSQYPAKSVDLAKYEVSLLRQGSDANALASIEVLNSIDEAVRRCIYDNWDALRDAAEAQLGKKKVWVLGKVRPDTYEDFCAGIKSYSGRHYRHTLANPDDYLNPDAEKEGVFSVKAKGKITRKLASGECDGASKSDQPLLSKVAGLIKQMPPCPYTGKIFGYAALEHMDYNGQPIPGGLVERISSSNRPFRVLVTYNLPFNLDLGKSNVYFPTQLRPKTLHYMHTAEEIERELGGKAGGVLCFGFVPPEAPSKRSAEEAVEGEIKRSAPNEPEPSFAIDSGDSE